ncbi:MAG TPA: hypothetical protein VHP14_03710 [Anaerolineales bacterium]|nr:hypothetical protein [Anaerolineales bacterium]
MKSDDATENVENKSAEKPAEPVKPKKEKKSSGGVRLPFLLEFTYTISMLVLIFLALTVLVTSFLSGAGLFTVVLRTVVAVIVVGGLLMLISSQISSGLLFAAKIEQEEAEKKLETRLDEKPSEKSAEKLDEKPAEKILHSIFDEEQSQAEAS